MYIYGKILTIHMNMYQHLELLGGASQYTSKGSTVLNGKPGNSGTNRQTGGGRNYSKSITIGAGGRGTSYSGGAGSGAANSDGGGGKAAASGAGSSNRRSRK